MLPVVPEICNLRMRRRRAHRILVEDPFIRPPGGHVNYLVYVSSSALHAATAVLFRAPSWL